MQEPGNYSIFFSPRTPLSEYLMNIQSFTPWIFFHLKLPYNRSNSKGLVTVKSPVDKNVDPTATQPAQKGVISVRKQRSTKMSTFDKNVDPTAKPLQFDTPF